MLYIKVGYCQLMESIAKGNATCLPFWLIESKFPMEDHLYKV